LHIVPVFPLRVYLSLGISTATSFKTGTDQASGYSVILFPKLSANSFSLNAPEQIEIKSVLSLKSTVI